MPEPQQKTQIIKIVVLGDSGVGKTSLIQQYVTGKFTTAYKTTIGVDFLEKQTVIDDKPVSLQIWDTAGQERFHSVCYQFYRNADGCIIVFDVTAKGSFGSVESWLNDFALRTRKDGDGQKMDIPIILVGNKTDLDPKHIEVPEAAVSNWCSLHDDLKYFKASAKTGDQVAEAFEYVASTAVATLPAQFSGNDEIFGEVVTRSEAPMDEDEGGKHKCC